MLPFALFGTFSCQNLSSECLRKYISLGPTQWFKLVSRHNSGSSFQLAWVYILLWQQ